MRAHERFDFTGATPCPAISLVAEVIIARRVGNRHGRLCRRVDRAPSAACTHIGEAHAIGRQQARERMDQHCRHAERIGDQAGMLSSGAAEAVQRIAGNVIAALDGDLLDRLRHIGDCDLDEPVGDFFRRPTVASSRARAANLTTTASASIGSIAFQAEDRREESGMSGRAMTLASVTASGPPRR